MDIYAEIASIQEKLGRLLVMHEPPLTLRLGAISYFRPGPKWDLLLAEKPAVAISAGLCWLTDDTGPNPYDTMPSYFDALCAALS